MRERTDHAPAIKAALTDPKAVLEALGMLGEGKARQRQSNGWVIRCPVHADKTPSCSVQQRDGILVWKCHGCQEAGDVLDLVAISHGLSVKRDFQRVLIEAARLGGLWHVVAELEGRVEPNMARPAPRMTQDEPEPTRTYPDGLETFWGQFCSTDMVELVAEYLRGRAIDPEVVQDHDLARVLPERGLLPTWARYRGDSWRDTGHRLILPVFDPTGVIRSVRAWRVTEGGSPKRLPPAGHKAAGLVLADAWALAWLRGAREPQRVVITEGEPDFLVWATRLNDPSTATIGINSGSWSDALADRFPLGCHVDAWVDEDDAGDRYFEDIQSSLERRCFVYRAKSAA